MKLIKIGIASLLLGGALYADCTNLVFGPPAAQNKALGYRAVYSTVPKYYYDENKEVKTRDFNEAYLLFFNQVKEKFEKNCKENNRFLNPVNLKILQSVDDNNFYFSATGNFEVRQ